MTLKEKPAGQRPRIPLARLLPATLKVRLAALVVLLVLAASVVVTFMSLMLAERDMKEVIGRQQFVSLAGAAAYIDEHLEAKKTLMQTLAEAVPASAIDDPNALHSFLQTHATVRNKFSTLTVFDREGRVVDMFSPFPRPPAFSAKGRPYFEDAFYKRRVAVSAPFMSMVSHRPIVLVSAPVVNQRGEVALVLSGSISLLQSSLVEPLDALKPGRSGYMFILSGGGLVVSHPDKERLLQNVSQGPGSSPAMRKALEGFEGWAESSDKTGSPGIYAYKRLRSVDWIVATRFPIDEALAPIASQRQDALVVAALVALFAGLLAWLGIRRLLAPLETLRRNVADIQHNRSSIDVLQLERHDEIGELSGAFYRLTHQREQAQSATRAGASLISNILERAPDAFISSDSNGVITEWNAQAEAMFGWRRDEAVGRNVTMIIPPRLHDGHLAGMLGFARSGAGPIVNTRVRVPALHRDGRELPVELSVGSMQGEHGYVANAFVHDVSMRIAFEEKIAAREKRIRMIADHLPALVAYLDRDARFQFTNSQYQRLWEIDPDTMLGRSMPEVFGSVAEPWQRDAERALAGQGRHLHSEVAMRWNEQARHLMMDMIPDVDADGAVQGIYLMALDITERKNAELRQAASEQKAEAASRAKSEFVANMSHEIRTPMNAVLGIAYLLGNTELNSVQRKYLDMISASGNALLGILNDVLDFSKIEAGHMALAPEPFQLSHVLNAIATVMTLNAGDKPVELAIGVEADVPQMLRGDAMRLQQVLVNLVSNAIKFTDSGEVSLLVEQAARDGDVATLRFRVRDSGIGISEEQVARLFSAFTQADASTTRRFGGTGLGLAISRRLISLMGGDISVNSVAGQGSEFVVTVPLEALAGAGAGAAMPAGHALSRLRLLVVDDNQTSRDYLCKTIAAWGWQADSAASGEAALGQLRERHAAGVRYDAVLADSQMPGMDGLATMAALRQALPADAAPVPVVIMVSAYGREKLMRAAEARQADAVLIKPVTASSLFDTLHEAIQHGAAQGHTQGATPGAANAGAHGPGIAAVGDAKAGAEDADDAGALAGMRLLLVEDNPLNQLVARGILEHAGALIELAENGQLAVDMLREHRGRCDAVLMDVQMPVMDGIEATRLIRTELGLQLPILAMSAGVMTSERALCQQAGMSDFIGKPIDIAQMLAVIRANVPHTHG